MSNSLFSKFASLNGASFIGVKGYINQYGEISNYNINVNVSIENAKKADFETLKAFKKEQLIEIAKNVNVPMSIAEKALSELTISSEKNLTADDRTAQSNAQNDAYISLTPGLRFHKDSMDVYIAGFFNTKEIIVEGNYPVVKKQDKTKIKDAIKKTLKMSKFRNFKIGNARSIVITGSTLQII